MLMKWLITYNKALLSDNFSAALQSCRRARRYTTTQYFGNDMTRALTESEKKKLAQVVGADLTKKHGKKKYYRQKQIKDALERNDYGIDIHCWAYCFFMDHSSFDDYHESINESCDYASMKESMISSVTDHASDSWLDFDFDLSWLELPDIDLSSIFDFIDW